MVETITIDGEDVSAVECKALMTRGNEYGLFLIIGYSGLCGEKTEFYCGNK